MLNQVIAALRARCPSFAGRVAGAAQFKMLPENAALEVPCAFVLPLDDNPKESMALNSVRQQLTDSVAIVVAVSNTPDERGQASSNQLRGTLRAELWAALLGWQPGADYKGMHYEGGSLLALDRARAWYQFEFGAEMEIGPEDGWQGTDLAALPHFDGATLRIDAIDPWDPNRAASGPDGRIETALSAPPTGTLP